MTTIITLISKHIRATDGVSGSSALPQSLYSLSIKSASAAFAFLMFVSLARLMQPAHFGHFGFIFSLSLFLSVVFSYGIHTFLLRYLTQYNTENAFSLERGAYEFAIKRTSISILLALFIFIVLSYAVLLSPFKLPKYTILCVSSLTIAYLLSEHLAHACRAYDAISLALLPRDIIWRFVVPLFAYLLFVISGELTATAAVLLSAGTLLLLTIYQTVRLGSRVIPTLRLEPAPKYDRRWDQSSMGFWGIAIAGAIEQNIPVVVLAILINAQEVAVFFAALKLSLLLSLPLVACNTVAAPALARYLNLQKIDQAKNLCRHLSMLASLLTLLGLFIVLISGEWLLSLFGDHYTYGYHALIILCVGHTINSLAGPTGFTLAMSNNEYALLRILVTTNIASSVLVALFSHYYGIIGASVAITFGIIIWNVWARYKSIELTGIDPSILSWR